MFFFKIPYSLDLSQNLSSECHSLLFSRLMEIVAVYRFVRLTCNQYRVQQYLVKHANITTTSFEYAMNVIELLKVIVAIIDSDL